MEEEKVKDTKAKESVARITGKAQKVGVIGMTKAPKVGADGPTKAIQAKAKVTKDWKKAKALVVTQKVKIRREKKVTSPAARVM